MKIGQTGLEQEIPIPKILKVDPIKISRKTRTANGKLKENVIAIKRNYNLTYQGLAPDSMKIFSDIYISGQPANFIYIDSEGEKTVVVNITSLPQEIPKQKPELNQNVSITMEEV